MSLHVVYFFLFMQAHKQGRAFIYQTRCKSYYFLFNPCDLTKNMNSQPYQIMSDSVNSNTTGATRGTGTANPYGAPESPRLLVEFALLDVKFSV
jgi:hypothetical protein